ncbi:hypothetical protein AB9128_22070 [Streptomyces cinereoruber]|uniref:DUF7674 family protein n=1 Tax=Streptomyces cinereoruber TaxID=67260 RepID=UPI003EC09970
MNAAIQLVKDLVNQFPVLEDSYETHVFNEGELLPHVFFWDVTQDVVSSFVTPDSKVLDWRAVLSFLEENLSKGIPEVNEAICTSFLWYLPKPGNPGYEITTRMGPTMTRRFQEIRPSG